MLNKFQHTQRCCLLAIIGSTSKCICIKWRRRKWRRRWRRRRRRIKWFCIKVCMLMPEATRLHSLHCDRPPAKYYLQICNSGKIKRKQSIYNEWNQSFGIMFMLICSCARQFANFYMNIRISIARMLLLVNIWIITENTGSNIFKPGYIAAGPKLSSLKCNKILKINVCSVRLGQPFVSL